MSNGSTAAVAVTWLRDRRDGVDQRALQGGHHGGELSRHRGAAGRDQGRYQRDHGDEDRAVLRGADAGDGDGGGGATQQLTAQGKMSDGSTAAVAVTWSATGGTVSTSGLYKAGTTAGSYRVIAVQQGGTKADTSAITVTKTALSSVVLTPATATVAAGATQQLTAQGKMSDGSTGAVAVTWSATGGTVSTSGLYKAGTTAGSYRVIAVQQGGTKADTSAITVTKTALSSVVLTPATATVAAGATQQFTAQGKLSDGSTGAVTVTYAATGGTVSTSGLYKAGTTAGTYRVIAVQQGGTKADTSAITVTATASAPAPAPPPAPAPAPANGTANPSALPTASGQLKNVTAYTALNVRGMAAGGSYTDPVTGVRVWKMTSASVPVSNPSAYHFYSEGPAQASAEWAPGKHTLYILTGGGYLVDFTRGSGFSNWRPVPSGTKQLTFSKNPATPRIAYVAVGTQLRRYDTGTNSYVDTGHFPAAFNIDTWLQQDKDDGWFVALGAGSTTVVAWNSATGQSLSRSFSGLDEPYLERDGRYIMVNASPTQIWDLATNTVSSISAPGNASLFHVPALRSFFMATDVNTGTGITPLWRVDPSPARTNTQFTTLNGYYPDAHASGMWVQTGCGAGERPDPAVVPAHQLRLVLRGVRQRREGRPGVPAAQRQRVQAPAAPLLGEAHGRRGRLLVRAPRHPERGRQAGHVRLQHEQRPPHRRLRRRGPRPVDCWQQPDATDARAHSRVRASPFFVGRGTTCDFPQCAQQDSSSLQRR